MERKEELQRKIIEEARQIAKRAQVHAGGPNVMVLPREHVDHLRVLLSQLDAGHPESDRR